MSSSVPVPARNTTARAIGDSPADGANGTPAPAEGGAGARKPRADAIRNRALLLTAARNAFAAANDDADVSLDAIARAAGVGIGTLYRNFPTREALVEALYASELDEVVEAASVLLAERRPGNETMRRWMDRYTRFVAAKQGMPSALRMAWASGSVSMRDTRARIRDTVAELLAAGAEDGTLRSDVTADDLTDMLVGVFVATGDAKNTERVGRLLDLLMDGLRP